MFTWQKCTNITDQMTKLQTLELSRIHLHSPIAKLRVERQDRIFYSGYLSNVEVLVGYFS